MKILYSYGVYSKFEEELKIVEQESHGEYQIIPLNHRKFLGWKSDVTPYELDDLYRNGHEGLKKLYNYVDQICNEVDVFYLDHECVYHPDFILELSKKVYTVIYSGDDPEHSYKRSKPYLYAFDHSFCYGIYHNSKQKMTDKFIEWGAKKADLRLHGCYFNQYDHSITEDDIINRHRDIEVIFIGGIAAKRRNDFLLRLKKKYKSKFQLYGNWGGIPELLSRIKHGYGYIPIRKATNDEFFDLYKRSKIGINIHQSFGPCNLRLYELPMNGVMQICDNKKGLSSIYELGKEVIGYDSFEEAIEIIDYYLNHDNERIQITLNGFRKAKSFYLFHLTFFDSMEKIKNGMTIKKLKNSL